MIQQPADFTPKITQITEGVRLDPGTTVFKRTKVVAFMVGTHGPFQIEIPSEQFSAARVQLEMAKQADEIKLLFPAG